MWCALRSSDYNSRERRTPAEPALKCVIQAESSGGSSESWKWHWAPVKSQSWAGVNSKSPGCKGYFQTGKSRRII